MPDVIAVFSRWWKWIAAITLAATSLALLVVLLLPEKYVSIATALPASSFVSDKATIFNTNIQELYSSLGTTDDLDRIIGTAHLDTIYIAAVRELRLPAHYKFQANSNGIDRAVQRLKKNTSITKSEWGELKIKVWDGDRNKAAQIANTLLQKLQGLHGELQNRSNQMVFQNVKAAYELLQKRDTTSINTVANEKEPFKEQLRVYERLLSEYSLMATTNLPALLVVENARPPLYADNSWKKASVLVTFFAAFLFSFLLALYTEGKKTVHEATHA